MDEVPEKISKTTAAIVTLMIVFASAVGYAFGLDKGYATGLADAGHQPIRQQTLQNP
jgi:hypothetical protein